MLRVFIVTTLGTLLTAWLIYGCESRGSAMLGGITALATLEYALWFSAAAYDESLSDEYEDHSA